MSDAFQLDFIVSWFARKYYEHKKEHELVPIEIQQIIQEFTKRIFNSKILSKAQDLELLQLLNVNIPTILKHNRLELLFRASEHNFNATEFHIACDGHSNTITIIKSDHGNIFGGYTTIPWQSEDEELYGNGESFLYLLYSNNPNYDDECPRIWNHIKECEIYPDEMTGPAFGDGCDLAILTDALYDYDIGSDVKSYCSPS